MLDDRAADVAELFTRREEVPPEVPPQKARREIDNAIDDQHPSEEKMPASPRSKVLITRQRDPCRKGPFLPIVRGPLSPSTPVVSKVWPSTSVAPKWLPSLSRAVMARIGFAKSDASPQYRAECALKICRPLISSSVRQSTLIQWVSRTSNECR